MLIALILVIVAYFLGSINTSIIVCKLFGLPSPSQVGSKNPGATNVLRVGGKWPAVLTVLGDALKAIIPIAIGQLYNLSPTLLSIILFFSIIGHMLPVFHHFKGGKGVATFLGGLLAVSPTLGILCIATWLIIAFALRYSSLAALITVILAPIYGFFVFDHRIIFPLAAIAIAIIIRHHSNITRLLSGTEKKIGQKA